MQSRRCQKIGALLGMLAILLSVVAPTVSQVLQGVHGKVEHHAHHSHHHHPAVELAFDAHAGHHHDSDSSLLCACPYCGLMAHSPVLPGAVVASSVAPQPAGFSPPVVTVAFRPYTVLTPAQPRAPPALS